MASRHQRGSSHSGPSGTSPGDFLTKIKGKRVLVKLNDGMVYSGNFICMDGNLNVVLETAELYENLQLAESREPGGREEFSDVFIRGNNVCYIAPQANQSPDKKPKKKATAPKNSGGVKTNAPTPQRCGQSGCRRTAKSPEPSRKKSNKKCILLIGHYQTIY